MLNYSVENVKTQNEQFVFDCPVAKTQNLNEDVNLVENFVFK